MTAEDLRQTTIDTYDRSAQKLSEYFHGIGPRRQYVDRAFAAVGDPEQARVLEIGCGDGRDAAVIAARTPNYLGIDVSESMIEIARRQVPGVSFEVADAATYEYPEGLDIVFAFASLLHLNRSEVGTVFSGLKRALKPDGIVYISSKYAAEYTMKLQDDSYGRRLFYYYNAEEIQDLAGEDFRLVDDWRETRGATDWFELLVRKT